MTGSAKISEEDNSDPHHASSWPQAILHLDMDAFFVNVHILEFPEDSGIPLAVGGQPESRGVIASASYEARQFGVHSAMSSSQAMRLCPQLKIVGNDWTHIRECSKQVMNILREYGPVEQMSVDEAYLDISHTLKPDALPRVILQRVKDETKLPASVGLATSKLVAKVASDFDKPEGCTIIQPEKEAFFLAPQPVRVIWGIGPRTAERLAQKGIHTCGQLAGYNPVELKQIFGRQARHLQHMALGRDKRPVISERGLPKSISQEWTFSQDVNDPKLLKSQLQKQSTNIARSLKKRGLVAHTVRVKFRWADFTTFTRQKSVDVGVDEADMILQLALAIWLENWPVGQKMRLLGVGVSALKSPVARQIGFVF